MNKTYREVQVRFRFPSIHAFNSGRYMNNNLLNKFSVWTAKVLTETEVEISSFQHCKAS